MAWWVQGEGAPAGGPQSWNLPIPHMVIGEKAGPEQRNRLTGASLIVNVDGTEDGGYNQCDTRACTVYLDVYTVSKGVPSGTARRTSNDVDHGGARDFGD